MDVEVVGRKGKRGRHRWIAQDKHNQSISVGMSPRDWATAEDAIAAGNALLDARAEKLKTKIEKLKESNDFFKAANEQLKKDASELRLERDRAKQASDLAAMDRKRDRRAVIIAYSVVFATIAIGVLFVVLSGVFFK